LVEARLPGVISKNPPNLEMQVEARLQGFIFKQEFNSRKEELKSKVG